jgi:hypothetical protein
MVPAHFALRCLLSSQIESLAPGCVLDSGGADDARLLVNQGSNDGANADGHVDEKCFHAGWRAVYFASWTWRAEFRFAAAGNVSVRGPLPSARYSLPADKTRAFSL